MKLQHIVWLSVLALLGGVAAVGFQGTPDKFGIVDVEKVFNDSTFAKSQTDILRKMGESRQAVLEFLNNNRTMKADDAKKFRDLTLKANPTVTDQADIDRLKKDTAAGEAKFRELMTKPAPTPDEVAQVKDFNARRDATEQLMADWQQTFSAEVDEKRNSLRSEALAKVRTAIQKVAKDQGFTLVFDAQVAPYAANDVTDAALKAMNDLK